MATVRIIPFILCATFLVLATFILWPQADLVVSGWFYETGNNFPLEHNALLLFMRDLAFYGARVLGFVLLFVAVVSYLRRRSVWKIDAKGWAFLFLALLLGPGLIANVVLKDHWGRARPREIVEFGGTRAFSPAYMPQEIKNKNGSFVSGDAAFGFSLTSFAYVVPQRQRSRRVFWGGMAAGGFFGLCRLIGGAHFLSDILFAMLFMLMVVAALHAAMFGRKATAICWRNWLFDQA